MKDKIFILVATIIVLLLLGIACHLSFGDENLSVEISSKNINYTIGDKEETVEIKITEEKSPYKLVQIKMEVEDGKVLMVGKEDVGGAVKIILFLKKEDNTKKEIKEGGKK